MKQCGVSLVRVFFVFMNVFFFSYSHFRVIVFIRAEYINICDNCFNLNAHGEHPRSLKNGEGTSDLRVIVSSKYKATLCAILQKAWGTNAV